ncbi:MAG: hypothetical protein EOM54_11325 [Clostridia bacterium]|nr:hypothetical protein [Clostridia bacterium]
MERLTERTRSGEIWYSKDGKCYGVTVMKGIDVLHVLKRLAAYEDTGLTPEEIIRLNTFEGSQIEKLLAENAGLRAQLAEANRRAEYISSISKQGFNL